MAKYIIFTLLFTCCILIGVILGFTFKTYSKSSVAGVSITPTSVPTIDVPTQEPTDYQTSVEYQQPTQQRTIPTNTVVPTQTEQLVDCSHVLESGAIDYDFGRITTKKCAMLIKDLTAKQAQRLNEIQSINTKMCTDTASFNETICTQKCNVYDDACYKTCNDTFTAELNTCTNK